MAGSQRSLKARVVFPVDGPPLTDATVTIASGRIARLSAGPADADTLDLGNVALLPGLVNAHTHLEFSQFDAPLGDAGAPFPDWIRAVVRHRRAQSGSEIEISAIRRQAVAQGLAESLQSGVTLLGEIAQPGWPEGPWESYPGEAVVFLELLGLAADRIDPLLDMAKAHLAASDLEAARVRRGISPHAPYTASLELTGRAAELSALAQSPLAMHLAETVEELELLQSASGPFVALLQELDAWDPGAIPRGVRPLDYLRRLARAHRALVIHGNYLTRDELAFLGQRSSNVSVVYCPRTHARFHAGPYPLPQMLAAGVHVALGTDSRASNPDLSLLEELRHAGRQFPEVDRAALLQMATLDGARALGVDHETGSLSPGKRADLAVVPLPDRDCADPHELIFDGAAPVTAVMVRGEPTIGNW